MHTKSYWHSYRNKNNLKDETVVEDETLLGLAAFVQARNLSQRECAFCGVNVHINDTDKRGIYGG